MRARYFHILLSATPFLVPIHAAGWSIDPISCPDPAFQQKIRDIMNWVFDQADNALAQLNKNPMDQDVVTIFPGDDLTTSLGSTMSKVKRVFQTIAGMRQEVPKSPYDSSTAIIYCTLKRFTIYKLAPDKFEFDDDLKLPYDIRPYTKPDGTTEEPKKLLDAMRSSQPWKGGDEARTKAFTVSRAEEPDEQGGAWTYYASQITIAPWYGEECYGKGFDNSKTYQAKRIWNKRDFEKNKWQHREIDTWANIKLTLFHEMVHTRAVAIALGLPGSTGTDDRLGYGWDNVRKGPQSGDDAPAVLNADSYAYFALVISFMKDLQYPTTVDRYGSYVRIGQALVQRLVRMMMRK